jgi:transposase-like protein
MKKTKVLVGRKGQKGRTCRYDLSFKQEVARKYIEGNLSARQVAAQYNVSNQHVCLWAKQFSSELAVDVNIPPMTEQEQKELSMLQKQIEALNKKLEYEQMRNFALETMIDLAKTELNIDLRKNSGAKQPEE